MFRRTSVSLLSLSLMLMLVASTGVAQDRRRLGPKARAGMTAGSGAALGAGIGTLFKGKRGAGIGALLGGGGATAAWLLKNENSRRRLGKYGQPVATIGAGTALAAGVGALVGGKRGAGIGALLGGGATTAGYLLAKRDRRPEYYSSNNGYYSPARNSYYRPSAYRATRRRTTRRCYC